MVGVEEMGQRERGVVRGAFRSQPASSSLNKKSDPQEVFSHQGDINLAIKTFSKEHIEKVEGEQAPDAAVNKQDLGINENINEPTAPLTAAKRVARKKAVCGYFPAQLCFIVTCFTVTCFTVTEGAVLKRTNQALTSSCLEKLKELNNDCPPKALPAWKSLNERCCGQYPNSILLCQGFSENGHPHSLVACLPEQRVSPGKIGKLIVNATGFPELDLTTDCPQGYYRAKSIDSSAVMTQTCYLKKKPESSERKICDGGTVADGLFVCKTGYKSGCSNPHNDRHDSCHCEQYDCGEGLEPYVNITGSCNDSITTNYTCVSSPPLTPKTVTSTPTPTASAGTTSNSLNIGKIVGGIVGGILAVAVIVIAVVMVFRIVMRRHRANRYCISTVLTRLSWWAPLSKSHTPSPRPEHVETHC